MTDTQMSDTEAETELKGKGFDEVCELIKNDDALSGAVYKKPDGAGRWSYCFGFRADEYTEADMLDLIVAEYGPGTFPVQFKGKQKNGRPRLAWQKHMHVQARRRGPLSTEAAPASVPAIGNDALAAAMERQAAAFEALVAAISKPPPTEKTTIDFVQDLAAIKDLFSDSRQSALEQFKDAMELRKLIKDDDGDGGSDPLSIAMRTIAPAIEKGIEAMQETERAQVRRPERPIDRLGAAARATPADIKVGPVPVHMPDDDAKAEALAGVTAENEAAIFYAYKIFDESYMPAIMQCAERGDDPELVADYLIRLVGDDMKTVELLGIVLMQNDMVVRFSKFNARVLKFTGWLDHVGDCMAHALWPAANPAPGAYDATKSATNSEIDDAGVITDVEATGDSPADPIASGESIPDAKPSAKAPRTGNDNDA